MQQKTLRKDQNVKRAQAEGEAERWTSLGRRDNTEKQNKCRLKKHLDIKMIAFLSSQEQNIYTLNKSQNWRTQI